MEHVGKRPWSQDWNTLKPFQDEKVLVACYNAIGMSGHCQAGDFDVIWVATEVRRKRNRTDYTCMLPQKPADVLNDAARKLDLLAEIPQNFLQ